MAKRILEYRNGEERKLREYLERLRKQREEEARKRFIAFNRIAESELQDPHGWTEDFTKTFSERVEFGDSAVLCECLSSQYPGYAFTWQNMLITAKIENALSLTSC